MGRIDHIIKAVCLEPWAILPEKLDEITALLELRMQGFTLSKEEVEARIGAQKTNESSVRGGGAVAVLSMRGVISHRMGMLSEMSGGISTERFSKMLRQTMADDTVGTIVIDIDSPGGRVPGVEELSAELREAR